MRLLECVPNFSEGRDRAIIDAIAGAIRTASGVRLLDVDAGAATNRTVYTFAGPPQAVFDAAFAAIAKGSELIDMRTHTGEHPRLGACDVCPFVPIEGISMEECVELARRLGARVGKELSLPVYLYAEAASRPDRTRLPDIRKGEYEGLEVKLKKPEWKPDYGPARFNAKTGAVVIGARNFLIAYNININSKSVKLAKDIACSIRERGRLMRDKKGVSVLGPDGKPRRVPGLFKSVQGDGWLIPEYDRAQITVNILDIDESPLHKVYEACCDLAAKLGCRVTGSEIVGMVPRRVLIEAGRYYLNKQGSSTGVSSAELVRSAILSLGLNDVAKFDPAKKIVEEHFKEAAPLAAASVREFVDALASNSAAPGGGSAAALSGALAAALAAMDAALTFEKKGFERLRARMEKLGGSAQELKDSQLAAVDLDAEAFNGVLAAARLPRETGEQRAERAAAVEDANKSATLVPLAVIERTLPTLEVLRTMAEDGVPGALSDAGAGALLARAAAYAAYYNVLINLMAIEDKKWAADIRAKADALVAEADSKADALESFVLKALRSSR